MQDLSFALNNPTFDVCGLRFSVQLFTFENVYGLDPAACSVTYADNETVLDAQRLTWSGGQETAEGRVTIRIQGRADRVTFQMEATSAKTIRCIKLVLHGLPQGAVVNLRETPHKPIPTEGLLLGYPGGWRQLYTPLVLYQTAPEQYRFFRSLDTQVREKRFAFIPQGEQIDVELIFEELATQMGNTVTVPVWEVGTVTEPHSIMQQQQQHIEKAFQLIPWEQREDVPQWGKEIALVAAIHCQHFTGYIFNDYAEVLNKLRWLAEHFDPQRTLVYLPGWEGRYYWQYGDYRPDSRMGGEEGFAQLIRSAHELGFHMMPMFGINVVNQGMENFEQWGTPAKALSAGGYPSSDSVDWDGSRHYDHGWGAFVNVGAPAWQNRLVNQINTLIERYGFEGVFLDITAGWKNDPHHDIFEGTQQLIGRIRQAHPQVLIAGEGWYDGMTLPTPLTQSGHTDGVMHWHDEPFADFFDTYNRSFAHLCLGDPGRNSTGVHELGYNAWLRAPLRKGILPTVTLVEDTLQKAPDRVLEVIEDAKNYLALISSSHSQALTRDS